MIDISWAGKIPDNWEYAPLKSQFSFGKGLSITKADLCETGEPVLSYGQIHSKDNDRTCIPNDLLRFVPKAIVDASPDSLAISGGFIFADTSEDLDGCGNCNYVDRDGIYGGYHTVILKPQDATDNKYLAYLFQTDAWRYQLRKELTEVKLYSVSQKALKSTWVLVPPISERQAIVRYLDSKCAAIDEAIERHKKIIEKLEEHRKASAFNAVTKGIAGAPLKASGEEWLGNIPENWSVQRNWTLFKEVNERGNESLPILTVSINTGISDRELSDDESERVFVRSADRSKYKRVQPGDIAYNMMRAWQGAFGTARVEGMVSPAYVTVRPVTEMDSRYYEYLMRSDSAAQEFEKYSRGITDFRLRLYYPEFSNIKVCVPPLSEQKEIADYLDDLYKKTDMAIKRITTIINKLEAYRKSIIYHAVTGKIDCRNS